MQAKCMKKPVYRLFKMDRIKSVMTFKQLLKCSKCVCSQRRKPFVRKATLLKSLVLKSNFIEPEVTHR